MGAQIDFFRTAAWLDKDRVRAYSLILLLGFAAAMVFYFNQAVNSEGRSDFLAFWAAGKIALTGNFAGAYNLDLERAVQATTGFGEVFAFVNPPPFLFAVMPFGVLPYPVAWIAWIVVTFALWAYVSWRTFPNYWPLILAYPGAFIAASHAQNGLLTGALLVGAVAFVQRKPWLGGAMIGAMVIKPHLALLIPFWLAAGRQWGAFVAAGVSAISLLLVSWLIFGSETMLAYSATWETSAALITEGEREFFLRMATLYGQLRVLFGHEAALAANGIMAAVMVAMVWQSWGRFGGDMPATGAFVLAATPLASPYLFNYDLAFLILPTLWLAHDARKVGYRHWDKFILLVLFLAPFVTRAFALPLGVNTMPVFSALMVGLIWQRAKST